MKKPSQKIWLLIWFLIILTAIYLSGCSAQWHYNRTLKKDPDFFQIRAVEQRIAAPSIKYQFDCLKAPKGRIVVPRTYIYEGAKKTDTVYLTLTKVDSILVSAEIDCPDPIVRTETIQLPPTKAEKKEIWGKGFKFGIIIGVISLFIILAAFGFIWLKFKSFLTIKRPF